jgi:hypothetical protein
MGRKILIIEDSEAVPWVEFWHEGLDDDFIIIAAFSGDEARKEFAANPDIMVIAIGDVPSSEDLVREFQKMFKGVMIAVSTFSADRQRLMEVGCDYKCEKEHFPRKLREIFELHGPAA